ncbi:MULTISPECIES: SPFH domain-containing protein [unclassified Lactococcus]|uniref:SPFH domain-containing protein n=1 Tax=unclassified Lactococcus TaxID=2643510 RepID=UPI0011CB58A5|nr:MULTISPECIES: SPFH domain-containing protein [unclassified Lactococcus]MQW23867.1 virion core protein [Lactococcus sp. dk101]TXK37203.1 virion core protein [Lactococcus sp. dk310]TXK48114.1 virion core protein [Lactococcus sp. dk322]
MGIIKAATSAMGGSMADQWLEVIEPNEMSDQTVFTKGVKVRKNDKRGSNRKGTEDVITDGSVVHVYPNMMMLLVDGGKIIDYTAEEGYYTVKNDTSPSMFNGNLRESIQESFFRFKFGGVTPQKQQVFYINLQEIKGIKFGTATPLQYFDNFYNAELFVRTYGTYSIKITDPLAFYANAIPKNKDRVEIQDINEQYVSEFLTALNTAINQYSAQGERVSFLTSKSMELAKYMSTVLDEDWKNLRGMEIVAVALASISYTEDSQKLINMRNQGAMLGDPTIREGYVQGAVARGMENAGSNPGGSTNAFMGMNMGMNQAGNFIGQATAANQAQQAQQQAKQTDENTWMCSCGSKNTGKFCQNCGKAKPVSADSWTCSCGTENTGKFCQNCGKAKPATEAHCSECGALISLANGQPKFCPECGKNFVAKA